MDLRLAIVDSGSDDLAYWFEVNLLAPISGEALDADRFRWAKQTKRVLLNQAELEAQGVPPQDWGLLGRFREQEANVFDYESLAEIAARHFLRRQGLIPRHVPGRAWTPAEILRAQPASPLPLPLAQRHIAMRGAVLLVNAPDIVGRLGQRPPATGTVLTVSTDYDGYWQTGNTCSDTGTVLLVGDVLGTKYRPYIRFPLTDLPAGATASDVDFVVNVTAANVNLDPDVQAYNQNGQANPSADTCTNRGVRCADDATPYLAADNFMDSTGVKTLQLPAAANTDVENAKAAVNRFSIGIEDDDASVTGSLEALDHTGTDEPKLTITYISADQPAAYLMVPPPQVPWGLPGMIGG